jgi:hypothetical protein
MFKYKINKDKKKEFYGEWDTELSLGWSSDKRHLTGKWKLRADKYNKDDMWITFYNDGESPGGMLPFNGYDGNSFVTSDTNGMALKFIKSSSDNDVQ